MIKIWIRAKGPINPINLIEPTCAFCTVGSYASLSVCPSVWTGPKIRLDNNQENMNYTLKKFLLVNIGFFVKIQATAVPLVEDIGKQIISMCLYVNLFKV